MAKKVTQPMEPTQITQLVQWLEEERRKDKALIAALQEQARGQEEMLSQQSAQIQDLQTKTAGLMNLVAQVTDFEQTVANYKTELVYLMDQREEARKKEVAESTRLRKMEYGAVTDRLAQLDKAIQVLPRYDERLGAQKAEDQRLSENLQRLEVAAKDLEKRSDDRVQAVTYLEEQRRADNRRIAELEHDTTDLRKRLETLATKLPLMEDAIQKQKARVEEVVQDTKKLEKPIEELRVSDFQREQKVKQYLDQAAQIAQEMERIRTQTQGFVEQQQAVKRALEKTESFQARIEKRQNEVAEMQRLAEDRVKRQWEEWQAEQLKEQKKRELVIEERWNQQGKTNAEHQRQLEELQGSANLHRAQLDALWEARRADAVRGLKTAQEEHDARTSPANEHLSALRGER